MRKIHPLLAAVFVILFLRTAHAQSYLGFDRNDYPGDANLETLRQTFAFTGYWLNNPPGEKANSWAGTRRAIQSAGFGFLVLFNGRLDAELKSVAHARIVGKSDARGAVIAARHQGFREGTVIFLDQEQGGRMLPEQKAYIYTWVDAITSAGFRSGIYCSGIAAKDDNGSTIITADDIRQNAGSREIEYFVTNDACPPSPGCALPNPPPRPALSGIDFAEIWQFAQSPRRKEFAAGCPANYSPDGNCYPPGLAAQKIHLDVETANTPDPSLGRSR